MAIGVEEGYGESTCCTGVFDAASDEPGLTGTGSIRLERKAAEVEMVDLRHRIPVTDCLWTRLQRHWLRAVGRDRTMARLRVGSLGLPA